MLKSYILITCWRVQGGVKFDGAGMEQTIFSRWMEILPTDQIVALEVEYDPETLKIKVPN